MSLLSFSSAIDCFLLLPLSLLRISYGLDMMAILKVLVVMRDWKSALLVRLRKERSNGGRAAVGQVAVCGMMTRRMLCANMRRDNAERM